MPIGIWIILSNKICIILPFSEAKCISVFPSESVIFPLAPLLKRSLICTSFPEFEKKGKNRNVQNGLTEVIDIPFCTASKRSRFASLLNLQNKKILSLTIHIFFFSCSLQLTLYGQLRLIVSGQLRLLIKLSKISFEAMLFSV